MIDYFNNVDNILSQLTGLVAKLDKFIDQRNARNAALGDKIARLEAEKICNSNEINRAAKVRANMSKLLDL